MKLKILDNNYTTNELISTSKLHKKILINSIATNMSTKSLSLLYDLLIKNKKLLVANAIENNEVIGSISVVVNKTSIRDFNLDFLKIIYHLSLSYIRRPINTLKESYFKYVAYKNIISEKNVIFLFVEEHYRGKKVASNLLNLVLKNLRGSISVDTNSDNRIAINFYKKNNFVIINQTKMKTVLILDNK